MTSNAASPYPAMAEESTVQLTLEKFAAGVIRVVSATMEKAIRVVSVERGRDPRNFALVAFGGAGGLHGCAWPMLFASLT